MRSEVSRSHPRRDGSTAPHRSRQLLWLALAVLVLVLLAVMLSTLLHRPTHVQLEVSTTRLIFTPGGEERHEILNRSVPFSSLVLEGCNTVVFAAEKLEVADPRQLVPGTQAGETPHFPATAWRPVTPTDPLRFSCSDPAAKVTLQNPAPAAAELGVLDRIFVEKGSQVILEVVSGREPAISLEITTPQEISLALGPDLELGTDFVQPSGIAMPFPGDLLTWRARLPEARRTLQITSGPHGLVLIVTPRRDQVAQLFRRPLDLPLASGNSVELLEEDLEGTLASPLRKVTLSYPDFPDIPDVIIENEEALGLGGLSQARLRSLALDADKGTLQASFEGTVERATSRSGAFTNDRRLKLYQTISPGWKQFGAVAASLVSILGLAAAVIEFWRKLRS